MQQIENRNNISSEKENWNLWGVALLFQTRYRKFQNDFSKLPFHGKFSFQRTIRVRKTEDSETRPYYYNTVTARGLRAKIVRVDIGESHTLAFLFFRLEPRRIVEAQSLGTPGARVWTTKSKVWYFVVPIWFISVMSGGEFNVSVCLFFISDMHQL